LFPSSNTISANEKRYLSKPSAALGEKRNRNRAAEQVNQFDFDRFYSGEVSPQSPLSPADAYDWGKGLRYLSKDFEDCESSSLSSPIECELFTSFCSSYEGRLSLFGYSIHFAFVFTSFFI
jgi:hypothetical protein